MHKIFKILMLMLAATLVACGGGGGEAGTSSGATPPVLRTTAPAALIMLAGTSQEFVVEGGRAPYRVTSNNVAVGTAKIDGNKLTVQSLSSGSAVFSVIDALGTVVTIGVSVSTEATDPTRPLFTTAPASVNIAQGDVTSYTITGGRPPYTATSSDLGVVRPGVSGSTLVLTGVIGGTASIVVSDMDGSTLNLNVSVGSSTAFFTTAPSSVTLYAGTAQNYLLSGGAKPYQVTSSDPAVAMAVISGTVVTVNAAKVGKSTLRFTDSKGDSLSISVEVVTDTPGTPVSADPVLKAPGLKDSAGAATNSISASGFTTLSVTLTSPSGAPLANQLISVGGDQTQVKFPEGASGLTNAAGVASIKVARASLNASGAGALTVTYSYKAGSISSYPDGSQPPTIDKTISTYVGYQLATANITLDNLDVGAGTLVAYGTRQVSVQVNLNGVPTPTPVQVNFTATCGQISPASASTNTLGKVTVSYSATDAPGTAQSTQGCSGKSVEISASTLGATVVSRTLSVSGAPATSMSFVSATPVRIYLANSGGATQSLLKFKLVNAQGEPILGRDVVLSLKTVTGALDANKATFGTVGNIAPITTPTDSNGEVSVPVFSGTVPTNVLINARLASDAAIQTDSAVLTIASGRPAQARVSLAIEKFAIEGFNVDGDESTVTMSLADRQGNPVPDGTAVNFVTEGGVMIPPVCTTGTSAAGNSQCTVKIRSQNPRPQALTPRAGRVSILAYAAGEEDFNDGNFNNVHDSGETFSDLGTAFRDDNENSAFDNNAEFSVPRTGTTPAIGDGVWGAADVRQQHIIIFATSAAVITPTAATPAGVSFVVADVNGNSMPTGSEITVTAVDQTPNSLSCGVAAGSKAVIPNTLDPFPWAASLKDCAVGDSIVIEVKTPKTGTVTSRIVPLL